MMRLRDLLNMAFSNLRRRKLRSALTTLAVVIGASLITLMVSLTSGLQEFITSQFGLFVPQDTMFVISGASSFFGGGGGGGGGSGQPREITGGSETPTFSPFTGEDLSNIRSIPGVQQVDFIINVSALSIRPQGSEKLYTVSVSTGPDYVITLRRLVTGSYFPSDASGQCLLPFNYVELFGWPDAEFALGKVVTIEIRKQNPFNQQTENYDFTIAGVIENTINASDVLVPVNDAIDMARFYFDNPTIYTDAQPGTVLLVKTSSPDLVEPVSANIQSLGYNVTTARDITSRINGVFNTVQIGLAALGIISLIVAAIGIINTLLMSIYERTREIGVMKAVGATRGSIRSMFTAEGAFLGFLGGVIGVLGAWIIGQLVNTIGRRTFLSAFPTFDLTVFPVWLIFGVVAVTTVIALLAALYPAGRAARLDPVEALRYE